MYQRFRQRFSVDIPSFQFLISGIFSLKVLVRNSFDRKSIDRKSIDRKSRLTRKTVSANMVYMNIAIVLEERLTNCPRIKQSLTRKLAKNQKRVEAETRPRN